MTDIERLKQAERVVARAQMQAARATADVDNEVLRKARTHMLCCLGGAALHWIGPVDPFDFVPGDFEQLFDHRVGTGTNGEPLTLGLLLQRAWKQIQSDNQ